MKKCVFILILVLILPLCLAGCFQEKETRLSTYRLDAEFDEESDSLDCQMSLNYVNNSESALDELCFFLYANSFDEKQKCVPNSYRNQAYYLGTSYGNITIGSVFVLGEKAEFSISSPQSNILTVKLQKQLFPNENVVVDMDFVVKLAKINHRLGSGQNTINFGNFLPLVCVYEYGKGFFKSEFSENGDPFYSDVANFEATIRFDKKFGFVGTGEVKISDEDGKSVAMCQAQRVRDFCFFLSENFKMLSKVYNGVEVNYFYYDDENAERHLNTAVDCLKTFGELFCEYPYKVLNVVKSSFCFGGMEYPNLVTISDKITDQDTYDYVIAHEIAHQWWYGLVGNNEFSQPWVDESLTDYSAMLFFKKNPSYNVDYRVLMENAQTTYENFVNIYAKINGSVDESMNRSLKEFNTDPEYTNCIYVKGVLMYDSLSSVLGERKFLACLKDYSNRYKYKNVSGEELIESFSKSSHVNLENFFKSWLEGNVVIG